MTTLAVSVLIWIGGGLGALVFRRGPVGAALGMGGAVAGCLGALVAGGQGLASPSAASWSMPWGLPVGALRLRLDALAGIFLVPIGFVGALCAIYGHGYLGRHARGESVAGSFASYNALLASMAIVVTANDLVLLLIAWELMTLSSWALVVSDHHESGVRAAGLQYLVASHLATAALLLLALFLAGGSGTFEIGNLAAPSVPNRLLFGLALIGFGTKAGIVPMHVWLPDAHPAAPSHVSALMSAVMITMGFYGIARFIPLLGPPPVWWAYTLLLLGGVGALGGVLFAVAQRDVKRVLAYSTVENAGIITLALGVGLLGTALGRPQLAGFGWTAAFLHLWNHALAKGALFLGFGAVAQAAGSRSLDALGGVLARWRLMGGVLVLASAAMASLPGLNVFTSEWLLLRGLLAGGTSLVGVPQAALLAAIVALALTGGFAVTCFVRLVGIGLLGNPRTAGAAGATLPGRTMWAPALILAAGCVVLAGSADRVAGGFATAVSLVAPGADVGVARATLEQIVVLLPLVVGAAGLVLALRIAAGRSSSSTRAGTWGCGYPLTSATMQYTSTSFGEPLTRVMQPVLHTEEEVEMLAKPPAGAIWPMDMRWASRTADRVFASVYQPLVDVVVRAGTGLRALYQPRVTASLLYIVVTMLALLALLFLPGNRG